ncbi:TlpA family protein disulfide reductase [Xanthomarina sp. F2636L]|uniref:TlpA family protein disulfide reductase n=1 Tax=Xanthomarina sp. F2636L TaxID=2996018 RepID=UPI00225E7009|nr:TlpA disulfide reductase family protein [Xanthomarina sp. F2636L]MCX7549446.1 TlpA disulfide reductase family protein [Xanthomarina sp. F2636L]
MKKIIFLLSAIAVISCQEEPKDYVTFSGKITNKSSDSIVLRTRDYSKTIKVNDDGTFSDTLKVETGIYNFFDGNESTNLFLKNGFDINVTLDTKEFDETISYTGTGSEHSNFLAERSLKEEKLLDMDELASISEMEDLDKALDNIKTELNEFYASKTGIDSSLINSGLKEIEPMLKFYKGYLADAINLKKDLPAGAPSPTFVDYENVDGTTTSLEDLRGKYTYIDVWATWCGPCKAEIPSLKALEKEYHGKNIHFVSLSIDDDRSHGGSWDKAREDWKAMIADKELSGIQLFAPEGWQTPFIKEYKINGIPRFILIDPAGNVVTPDAPRPSSEKLKELFNSLEI